MKRNIAVIFFLLVGFLMVGRVVVRAAETVDVPAMNLTLSPVSLQVVARPSETVTKEVKIRNNTTVTETLRVSIGKFRPESSGDRPILMDPEPNDPSLPWVSIDPPVVHVNPSEWQTVRVTFSPAADAAGAEYYSLLFSRESGTQVKGATQIQGAPAILMLATIDSPLNKRELTLTQFLATHHVLEFLPTQFHVSVKNTGNVHIIPQGNIFIDGQGKKDVAVLSLNPNSLAVLPDSSRVYTVDWNDGFPLQAQANQDQSGTRVLGMNFDWSHGDRFRIGRYTAHLLLVYDNGERDIPIESVETFWIIPWRLLLGAGIILLLVGIGLRSTILGLVSRIKRLFVRSS